MKDGKTLLCTYNLNNARIKSFFICNRRSVDSPFLHVVDKPRTEPPVKHKRQTRSKSKSRQKRQDDVTETEEIGMHGIDIFNNTVNKICIYVSILHIYPIIICIF